MAKSEAAWLSTILKHKTKLNSLKKMMQLERAALQKDVARAVADGVSQNSISRAYGTSPGRIREHKVAGDLLIEQGK